MALPTFEEFYSRAKSKYPTASDEAIKAAYSQRTGQDAVFTQGPSFEDFSSRAVAKYGPMDPNVLKQAYDARYSSSYLTDLKRAAKRGFGQFGDVVGVGLEAVGADDLGSSVREYWQETQDENRQSVEGQNRSWYNPAKILESSVEMGVNMLPTLGIGGGLGTGARLLGAGTRVAGAIGTGAASGVGGVQEAVPFYEQMIEQGIDPETARARAAALGVYVAASSAVPTGRILGRAPGRVKTGLWEAGTETSEETVQALLEGKDPIKATIEGAKAVGPAAFLMGAGLGAGGQAPSATAEEEFRRQAGLEDTPTPEPVADVEAQVAELGKTRRGVYLAPGQAGDFPGIKVPVPGGGQLLVQKPEDAQEALLRFQTEDRQTVLGEFTGAGMQPKPRSDVVVQAMRDGKVIRESVVLPEDAQETAKRFEAELGVPARITTAQEALKRRSDLIQAEGLGKQPGLPKSGGIDRNRPYPPGVQPAEPGEPIDYNPPTDLLVPKSGAFVPDKGDTVNLGQRVVVPGTGVIPAVAADRDAELVLDVPKTVKGYKEIRAMEAGLPNQAKAELAAQARDAEAFLPQFTERLANIAERVVGNRLSVFGEFQPGALVAPVKSAGSSGWARVIEKVVTEEGGNPTLKDFGRATILVRNKAEAQAALDAILADFGQAPGTSIRRSLLDSNSVEDVLARDPYGYADVKLNVPGPNGRIYEVQITTPELFRLKEEQGHKFYERGRKQEGKFLTAFQKVVGRRIKNDTAAVKRAIESGARMFRERDPLMQKEYQGSREVYLPALEAFLSASQSASNSASEISTPSARMDEGVTGTNESPTSLAPTAPDSNAGLPSTEKNFIPSISTSNTSVAGDSQGGNRVRTISVPGSGRKFQVRSRIVSLSQVLSSDQPGYDQRKQPRDREGRVALQLQAENIAAKLDPNQLMESRSTADGAPVVSPEGLVESGNGRIMALRIAQQKHPENYAAYIEALRAEGFNVDGIADPVLVQERVTPMSDEDVIAYTQEANARGNASLSATEQAKMDARLLNETILSAINSGDMSQQQNNAAVSAFFDLLPTAERNGLVDAKGNTNAAGERRAEAALVAKAYGNANGIDALLDRLYETQDEGVRRITNALRMASYKFAELRLSLDTERVPAEYDISQDVINAYNLIREGKAKGIDPWYLIKQGDLNASPNQDAIVRMFYKPDGKEQSTETIASQLIYYAQQANQQRLDQGGLFGENETILIPPDEILTSSLELIGDPHPSMPDKGSKFARQGQHKPGSMQAWAVKQITDPIVRRWNPEAAPRVVVVQDAGELPAEVLAALGPDINGATDLNTGTVYLVANNLPDTWTAQRILAHEAVGHFGFDRLYGDRFEDMVGQIIALEGKDGVIRKIGQTIDRHYDNLDRSTRAAEIVAHLAETMPKHPLAKRVIAQFREILRAIGFRLNLSRNDLVYMIRRSADAMRDRTPIQRDLSARELKPGPMEKRGATSEANLIAQHNLSFNNLRHLMNSLGGKIPVPSIAITKVGTPMVSFGEVTLLGDATLIDPRGPNRTKVFGADIYSPRYPKIQRFMKKGALQREFGMRSRRVQNAVAQDLDGFLDSSQSLRQAAESLAYKPEGLELYAIERLDWTQEKIEEIREEAIARFEQETGVDRLGFSSNDNFYGIPNRTMQLLTWDLAGTDPANFLRTKVGKDVVNYLEYRLGKIDINEKIFLGYDDRLGTRRYAAHTLDNVVREMKRNLRGGENDTNIYGVGQVRAHVTPEFSSRRDITANKSRLVDKATFEAEKDRVEDKFLKLANEMFGSSFGSLQNMSDFMVDVARGGIDYAYRKMGEYNIPVRDEPEIRASLEKLRTDLRDMPTEYFEAKITKPVELNQFKAAVVPDDIPTEIREFLEAAGIKIFEYDSGAPASYPGSANDYVKLSRKQAIEQAARNTEGALFASRAAKDYSDLGPGYRREMERMDAAIDAAFQKLMAIDGRLRDETKHMDPTDIGDFRRNPEYRDAQDEMWRLRYERTRRLTNFRRWIERDRIAAERRKQKAQGKPPTDEYGRPLDEKGRPLDQQGRPIPRGQEDAFGLEQAPAEPAQEQQFYRSGDIGGGHAGLIYFTADKAQAQKFERGIMGVPGERGPTRSYKLEVRNPLDLRNDPKARAWALEQLKKTGDYAWLNADEPRFAAGYWTFFEKPSLVKAAKAAGYDAMVLSEYPNGEGETVAVFNPTQVSNPIAEPAQEQPFNLAQQQAPREEIADPGTADLFGLSQLANEPIRGQAPPAEPTPTMPTKGQGRLFASRGATITEDLPLETPAQPVSPGPAAWAGPVKVGGGEYSLKQFGKLDQAELNVLHSVIGNLEAPVAEQRRGERSWTATEKAALDLVQEKYGVTLDGLVNRKPGSAANAEQLEAYGMMIGRVSSELKTLVDGMGRNPSSAELARLAELKERLGMLLAPAMGYQTEAGRALNILRKISGELRNADDILAAMGDGAEGTLKDFARRVRDAGSIDQVVGLTKAAYSPTWWDKFYEYWINGLLSGPTTHSVNMVSNAIFQGLESAAEFAAAPFSKDVSTRAAMARLAALPHGITLGMANAKQAFLEERAILTPEDKLEGEHNKAIGGKLGKTVRLPGRMLQAEDEFFKATAYTGELAALAMEEAIRTNPADVMGEFQRIMGSVPQRPDLIKAAKRKAAQVTFTTPLGPNMAAFSRILNKSKVGRLIIPFIRTPTNILFEATKYTPAAPLLEQVRKDLSNGGRDAALGWSRMAIGSSIMLGFAAMAAQGILSGAGPDDDATRAQLMRQGWRPYSIKLPDGSWLKYNRFEPFGMLTGLAADLFEIGSSMSDGDYSAASSMLLTSLASNLGDKTFLRGVTEFSQAYADPKRYLSRWANGMLSSPVPNAIAQTTRWLDPYQREANTILDNYKAKLPGMSDQLAKRLDLAGDPIKRDTGMPGNPFATSEPRKDPLAAAMVTLGVRKNAPGKSLSVAGRNYRLQGEAYTSYKGYIQKARYQVLTPLVNSPQFRQLMAQNPTAAQALLEKQWDDVGRQARLSWLYKNPTALGNPVQAPGGKDLAGSYALN